MTDPLLHDPRAALVAERDRLRAGIAEGIVAPGPMTYGSQAAAASQVFEQQRDLALRDHNALHLEAVLAALARLDDGTYGACLRCDRPIAPERLDALPWAAHCIDCQRIVAPRRLTMDDADPARHDRRRPRCGRDPPRHRRCGRRSCRSGGRTGARFLKAESLQPIGAFKIRGAYTAVASLTAAERARGVITYSSGNHAQGVARSARLLGAPAVVVMPSDAPGLKRSRVEADGAEVVVVGTSSEERQQVAERIAAERGLAIIPPYDDDRIIAGQGTVGLEIAEDLPDVAAVLVPIGGGGLASGVCVAIRALAPAARLIGVEPELAADARDSLRAGRIVRWSPEDSSRTIADGTRTTALGRRTFAHLSRLLDDIVTVSEAEIAAGVRLAAEESRLVAEPSGALTVAALAFRRGRRGWTMSTDRSWRSSPGATSIRTATGRSSGQRSTADARPQGAGSRSRARRSARRDLADAGRVALGVETAVDDASWAFSWSIQPARIAAIPARNRMSPLIHIRPPAICWSSRALGPHDRTSVA